jgi:acetylglutamate kinase
MVWGPGGGKTAPDPSLIRPLVKAHSLRDKIVHGGGQTLAKLAEREGINASYFTRLLRLTFLAPDITRVILEGRQPPDLTAAKLLRDTRLPLAWEEQPTALGFV